jgi:hypothetical protein
MNAELLFYDECECDMCDSKNNVTAHINTLGNDVLCICVNCLNKIVLESPSKIENRIKYETINGTNNQT